MSHATPPALSNLLDDPKSLIEASAGTGKTWTLTALIIRLLLERGARPKQIIATTFTRKAATELRTRIYRRLEEIAQTHAKQSALPIEQRAQVDDPLIAHLFSQCPKEEAWLELKKKLQIAQAELDQMFIGTLDGLCQKWLLEYRLETGADEGLQHVDEAEIAANLVHQTLRHYHHQIQSALPDVYAQYLSQHRQTPDEVFRQTQNALMFSSAKLHTTPLPPSALPDALPKPDDEACVAWVQWLEANRAKLNGKSWADRHFAALHTWLAGAELDNGWHKRLTEAKFNEGYDAEKATFTAHPVTQYLIAQFEYQTQVTARPQQIAQSVLSHVATQLRERLPQYLEEHHQTTYGHSLQRLNQALDKHPHLASQINHQYPIILVDESQDLNDTQSALLQKIYLNVNPRHPQSYLLLVGDPKQAIYQFRGGDVENYNHLKALFNESRELTENHRSNPNLIAALNHHYKELRELSAGIRYEPVHPAPNKPKSDKQKPDIVARDGSQTAMFWVACQTVDKEIEQIANAVAYLLSSESILVRADGKPLENKDILVLLRTRDQLQKLERELNKRNIAADFHNDRSIFESPVAQALLILWHTMWQPSHQGAQNRLLSSLFYQQTLEHIRAQSALPLTEVLSEAKELWYKYGVQSALYHLLEKQNIWDTLAQSPEADQHLNDLRRLLEIIAQYGKSMNPESFIHWWEQQIQTCPTTEWAQALPTPKSHAVRLMTIHKSKGLEADVVLVGGFRGNTGIETNKLKLYSYHLDGERHLSAQIEGEAAERIKQAEIGEDNRLIYVALTRAKQALWVFYRESTNKKGEVKRDIPKDLQKLLEAAPNAPYTLHNFEIPQDTKSALLTPTQPNAVEHSLGALVKPPAKIKFDGTHQTSFTNLTRNASPESRNDEPSDSESASEENTTTDYPSCFPSGARGGNLVHELLEKIDFNDPHNWKREIQRQLKKHGITDDAPENAEDHVQQVKKWLEQMVNTPLAGSGVALKDLNPHQLRKELKFKIAIGNPKFNLQSLNALFARHGKKLYLAPEDRRAFTFLEGIIDLVYAHEGKLYVVDYKTNFIPSSSESALATEMKKHQYELQAALYQLALWRFIKIHHLDFTLGVPNYYFVRYNLQYPVELIDENFLNELDQCFQS